MANNPNRNKLRREFEREEAWWNGLTEEQKHAQRAIDELRGKLHMVEHARDKERSAAWDALPREDRDTWQRINSYTQRTERAATTLAASPIEMRALDKWMMLQGGLVSPVRGNAIVNSR
jgi:hypothetical protein